jgi:uncharacterized protein YdaU (DUF1376 family)
MTQPLPWFAFNISKYLSETMGLDTEGHGAYLLLILHYYATGTPPKDNDRSLANITKLPPDRWAERRDDLAAFFTIVDGFWRHDDIEADMLDASSRHAASIRKGKAGAEARWGKAAPRGGDRIAPRMPRPSSKQCAPGKQALGDTSDMPVASSGQSSENGHLHKPTTTPFGRSSTQESQNDNATAFNGNGQQKAIATPLSDNWILDDGDIKAARSVGMSDSEIDAEVLAFRAYNISKGKLAHNWSATWELWCLRWKERKPSKARSSVEMSSAFKPTEKDWDFTECKHRPLV